jgi:DNA helicase HerA-like ATPase
VPVSILASLKAPIPWESNRELLRERISGTVTALLGLVGLRDIDPVRSREHILLANIFEHAWSQGRDLDLGELILQTQEPPFEKLGVFDVSAFFPEKERFSLAMLLNNILAAPAFQTWIEGPAAGYPQPAVRPRRASRATASSTWPTCRSERMFFVTLLFSAVETWMRPAAASNRCAVLLYFDEIFGYLPPAGQPAQQAAHAAHAQAGARLRGGLVLVTQNPVDLDYKALSNAGTWFIGKLQTEQDKQRLLDGLQGRGKARSTGASLTA